MGSLVERPLKDLQQVILDEKYPCPSCGSVGTFTEPRSFNLMFKTSHGVSEDNSMDIYIFVLETAQEFC